MATPSPAGPGHSCWLPDCLAAVEVQWRRRPTAAELDALTPAGDPGPPAAETVRAVHSCGPHAITLDAAAHVHQESCAPDAALLPACGCTPEPVPVTDDPFAKPPTVTLPTGWMVPAGQ